MFFIAFTACILIYLKQYSNRLTNVQNRNPEVLGA